MATSKPKALGMVDVGKPITKLVLAKAGAALEAAAPRIKFLPVVEEPIKSKLTDY
ncbi:MAG: hypothetical protein WAV28_08285 [Sedimentisphaerales bacterium]